LQYLQRAERGGHIRATLALAQLYDNGMGGLKRSCRQAVLRYKKVCEVGPWVDSTHGPREAVREFRRGREGSALTLSLLAALEGYEVAQFNAAWMLMRGKGMEESNVIFSASRKKNTKMRYETAASVLLQLTQQSPGNAESNLLLGDIFMGGYQVSLNLNSSAVYYERAAEGGSVLGTVLPRITLCYHAVLCCAVLYCVVPCCIVLY
jgi:SEL1 protein